MMFIFIKISLSSVKFCTVPRTILSIRLNHRGHQVQFNKTFSVWLKGKMTWR